MTCKKQFVNIVIIKRAGVHQKPFNCVQTNIALWQLQFYKHTAK